MVGLKYYVGIAALTAVLFAAGIWAGTGLNSAKLEAIQADLHASQTSQADIELQMALATTLDNNGCSIVSKQLNSIVPLAAQVGDDVEYYEATQRFADPGYLPLKRDYTLTLVRYWLLERQVKERCDTNSTLILYFYSNKDCARCSEQGAVLSFLKRRDSERIKVFALDTGLGLGVVDLLKATYGVTEYPSLVIDSQTISGYRSLTELAPLLGVSA